MILKQGSGPTGSWSMYKSEISKVVPVTPDKWERFKSLTNFTSH